VPDRQGGPIQLLTIDTKRNAAAGDALHIELYWLAETPVAESYTVFTQLIDPSGALVAQQDNLPVEGLAPTNTWQPNTPIRDPYVLQIPADAAVGEYRLLVRWNVNQAVVRLFCEHTWMGLDKDLAYQDDSSRHA